MSNSDNSKKDIWSYLGKIGLLVALIWGLIQIINFFYKSKDYEAVVNGNHSFYETSPKHRISYTNATEYKALVKTIIKREGNLKTFELDTLLSKIKNDNNSILNYEFRNNLPDLRFNDFGQEYNEIWTFSVKNTGDKPLEELALELPFDGICKIILPDNVLREEDFKNKIQIGELRPSYEANIIVWGKSYSSYISSSYEDEEKSRFTHKYGWFSIKYPVEVKGFYAWNKKYDDMPLMFGSMLILMFVFLFGTSAGAKLYKKELESKQKKETDDKDIETEKD